MRDTTYAFIKELTARDKKTLSLKGLKTCEEAGELASKLLSYEGAAATTHRFVVGDQVLEEAVDVMLCVMSIAFELGYSPSKIEEVILEKASKWQSLLDREQKVRFPMAYELHVTVNTEAKRIPEFKQVCQELGVKPLVIDLQNQLGEVELTQVMTSSGIATNDEGAKKELYRISEGLKKAGFEVTRGKIESPPFHPAAPMLESGVKDMPKGCYFEAHLNVIVDAEDENSLREQEEKLIRLASELGAHHSKNAFKTYSELSYTRMLTMRSYKGTSESFRQEVKNAEKLLKSHEFNCEKVIVEFSLFDDNLNEDQGWAAN